jgi:arginine deiminase
MKPVTVIVHTPQDEVFAGVAHPAAALFERPFSLAGAQREHHNFICQLKKNGAQVFRLVDILLAGTMGPGGEALPGERLQELQNFAAELLQYDTKQLPRTLAGKQQQYKKEVISKLHPQELVTIILNQPTIKLVSTAGHNTGFNASYTFNPVMNMYFMRDQVITTSKGVVVGRFNAAQREVETRIAKFAYQKLGIKPIYEVTGTARLEGGDFLPAGDVAFLGQGLRTNAEAVQQLLKAQVFGSRKVVIVKDSWKNQDQMHLDTYFNILDDKLAVLVDFRMNIRDAEGKIMRAADPKRKSTVDVYELGAGGYKKVKTDVDLQEFLEKDLGMTLIPISSDDQLKYGVNFLSVGKRKILAIDGVSSDYKNRLGQAGVDATWIDFHNLTGGYGAAHCTTQVIHRQ